MPDALPYFRAVSVSGTRLAVAGDPFPSPRGGWQVRLGAAVVRRGRTVPASSLPAWGHSHRRGVLAGPHSASVAFCALLRQDGLASRFSWSRLML